MQGLFFSVTATFSALVLTLVLYVMQHKQDLTISRADEAYMAKAQATYFIQTLQDDIENMYTPDAAVAGHDGNSCHLSMTRDGRTRSFTFPKLRYDNGTDEPSIVYVTYELEGQARQIQTRNGTRDLYRLRRTINEGKNVHTLGGSTAQIVDFLVELVPDIQDQDANLRILAGDCPANLNAVRVEFRIALPELTTPSLWSDTTVYSTTVRYAATIAP